MTDAPDRFDLQETAGRAFLSLTYADMMDMCCGLSNIAQVEPLNPTDHESWARFIQKVSDEWTRVATTKAEG